MPEINLLQNKVTDKTHKWDNSNRMVIAVFGVLIIIELVAGGIFYMLSKNANDSSAALEQERLMIRKDLDSREGDLADARAFQAQARNIEMLLANHVVWTRLVQEVADSTFVGSRYMSLSAGTNGGIHVEGMTSDYSGLGKLLLALQTSEEFESVKLLSSAPSTTERAGVLFSIDVQANQQLLVSNP